MSQIQVKPEYVVHKNRWRHFASAEKMFSDSDLVRDNILENIKIIWKNWIKTNFSSIWKSPNWFDVVLTNENRLFLFYLMILRLDAKLFIGSLQSTNFYDFKSL